MKFFSLLIAASLSLCAAAAAQAQSYPAKPVRVIVQFPPGGTPDTYGRVMAAELAKVWNQSVVVENRTGASGNIGTDYVAKAPADGYTLLFAADAPMAISPALFPGQLAYDPIKDFAPIINVVQGGFVLMAHPSVPANNLKELIALVQSQPGKWSYASSGAGGSQHLAMEMIRSMAGKMDMAHIPYKGFGQALVDVLSGQVAMLFGGATASTALVQSGKLKGIAITSKTRARMLPNVPAAADTLPGFQVLGWYAFFAPAATPRDLVRRIHADALGIVKRPDFQERALKDNLDTVGSTPEELAAQLKADIEMWTKLVKIANVKAEQ
jgi:tripartite-type tricarboxylate transporter receptor subunit TctC